ncbi:MAG: hypothetical protein FWC61_02795 [Proteobacteria bacterium]|nr:hypothetical protein [Pseudomonadota bacterium]
MKKVLMSGLFVCIAGAAFASDGGLVGDYNYVRPVRNTVVSAPAPQYANVQYAPAAAATCGRACGAPIAVKTGTEIIDHFQMFQPVTVYQPAGTFSQRRVVQNPQPVCNRCQQAY